MEKTTSIKGRTFICMQVLLVASVFLTGCTSPEETPQIEQEDAPTQQESPTDDAGPGPTEDDGSSSGSTENGTGEEDDPQDPDPPEPVETVMSANYTGGTETNLTVNDGCREPEVDQAPDHLGGACFSVPAETFKLHVEVQDETEENVAFVAVFVFPDGNEEVDGPHCDEADLEPPGNIESLGVSVEGPASGTQACMNDGAHAATTGKITATFTHM